MGQMADCPVAHIRLTTPDAPAPGAWGQIAREGRSNSNVEARQSVAIMFGRPIFV